MNLLRTFISAVKHAKQKIFSSVQKYSIKETVDTLFSLGKRYFGVKKRWIAVFLVLALLTTSVRAALERQVSNEIISVASEDQHTSSENQVTAKVSDAQQRGTAIPPSSSGNRLVADASAPQKRGTVTPPKEYKLYYHFQDHLGNTVLTTDADSNIVEVIDYKPFGEINVRETYGDYKSSHTYNDKENDPETDLYYYGQRYYDGGTSRFTSIDPALFDQEYLQKSLTDPQTFNSYSYAKNNPVNYIDPTGEYVETVLDVISLTLSAQAFLMNPSIGNATWLFFDAGATLLGFIPAPGYIKHSAKAYEIYKYFAKIAKDTKKSLVHIAKTFGEHAFLRMKRRMWSPSYFDSSLASLVGHFEKHEGKFDDIASVKDYYRRVNDFLDDATTGAFEYYLSNGKLVKYNRKTKELAIVNQNNEISTFFIRGEKNVDAHIKAGTYQKVADEDLADTLADYDVK